ncbi:MAG: hypothetical protein AB1611_15230 [bacterium]
MERLKIVSLVVVTISLGLLLVSCGGGGGGEGEEIKSGTAAIEPIETRGTLDTLSNDASMRHQPHYQQLEILPTSYIQVDNNGIPVKQPIKGSITGVYSSYDGQAPQEYNGYDIFKYEVSYHIINIKTNLSADISNYSLMTELDGGEYRLGNSDSQDPTKVIWEDKPVHAGFKTYEIGATYDYASSSQQGRFTVLTREYITVGNIRYPAWKVCETSQEGTISGEEYRWINPEYGTLKVQLTMSDSSDNSVMFLEAVLQESY